MNDLSAPAPRRILVTGATGRLGKHVCAHLSERGHQVRATDRRYQADFPSRVLVGDLKDERFVYAALDGCDAVVHLGNHPHPGAGPSRPGLLAENTAMNANVLYAAVDTGVRSIVFASSIQVMLRCSGTRGVGRFPVPYFPLDSAVPVDPGSNPYALSKEFGERLLSVLCAAHPDLSGTVLRYPMLSDENWLKRVTEGVRKSDLNWADCLTYLPMPDAAEIVSRLVERNLPGYRQYFPATSFDVTGYDLPRLVSDHYPDAELRRPLDSMESLVDQSFSAELGISLGPRVRAVISDAT